MHRGRPKFLQGPLLANAEEFPTTLAEHFLIDGPDEGAIAYAEKLAAKSSAAAPVEFGDLKESDHPKVTSDGAVIYDRPPLVARPSAMTSWPARRSRPTGSATICPTRTCCTGRPTRRARRGPSRPSGDPLFRTSELADWLTDADIDAPFYFDGQDLAEIEQDIAVVLTLHGGGPTLLERTYDTPTLQVLTRGPQFDPKGAEDLAFAIDDALLGATVTTVGVTRVISIDRVGGPPSLLARDSARRNVLTANYIFQSARTVF